MTYGQFLLLFLCAPIAALALLMLRDQMRKSSGGVKSRGWAPLVLLLGLVIIAIVYTIPWDNHLIAERVWWYRSSLVSDVTIGWIPLEEVLFFAMQTILIGLWVLWLMPRMAAYELFASMGDRDGIDSGAHQSVEPATPGHLQAKERHTGSAKLRWIASGMGATLWLAALIVLLWGWRPGTYLGWELVWALPPLIVQLALGGDILWRHHRLLWATLAPAALYLSAADALAIHQGIWTVSPHRSLGFLLGGILPLEELVFFLLTSSLITSGLVLGMAPEMRRRIHLGVT